MYVGGQTAIDIDKFKFWIFFWHWVSMSRLNKDAISNYQVIGTTCNKIQK
jgi:hypothetical protein